MKRRLLIAVLVSAVTIITGCKNFSVFNGGTGGLIVDAESTSTPKQGIASVDIYAYTDSEVRDSDYSSWREGTVFSPSNNYYGHTTTDANGNFTISNIVWTEKDPDFGKDADYTTIYLLYYHENYGLIRDDTVITSDSTSNTVYAELKAIRKSAALNINIYDVANSNVTSNSVMVSVSVPQNTATINAQPKVYEQIITGSGTMNISYPRWKNADDKKNGIENTPEISIKYFQSADEITWKACANADNEAKDYSFYEDDTAITRTVMRSPYTVSLYGKATRMSIPSVSGFYGDTTSAASDGVIIAMKAKDADGNFTIDCGETTTVAEPVGTNGTQNHGSFSNLGNGFFWNDSTYTGKYTTIDVKFFADGNETSTVKTLRSDVSSYNYSVNQ